jgi:hypothetical protein
MPQQAMAQAEEPEVGEVGFVATDGHTTGSAYLELCFTADGHALCTCRPKSPECREAVNRTTNSRCPGLDANECVSTKGPMSHLGYFKEVFHPKDLKN